MSSSCCQTPANTAAAATPTTAAPESVTVVKPRYAVTGDDQAYTVRVELPGVPKDAVSVDYDKNVLTIQGTRKTTVPETWKPRHRELNDFGYALRLKLNTAVEEEKFVAQLADGVLTLTLPIREAAKPRRIEVNQG